MDRKEFIAAAAARLAALSGKEHEDALAQVHVQMDELVRAAAEAEVAARAGRQVAELESDYRRVRGEREALAFLASFTRPEGVAVLMPHALQHISVERRANQWVVAYTDKAGNPATVDTIREQFRADPAFARLVQGTSESEREAHRKRVEAALGMSQRMH